MVLNNQAQFKKSNTPFTKWTGYYCSSTIRNWKTGAFTIGTLGQIDTTLNNIQGIVLSPTRELSKQIYNVFNDIGND